MFCKTPAGGRKPRLAVFSSGAGSTFEYLASKNHWEVGLLLTDRKCEACRRAENLKVSYKIISPQKYSSYKEWDRAVATTVLPKNFDLIVLAGFLRKLGSLFLLGLGGVLAVNSHPSLLPLFGGKGMYGIHVHQAVLKAKKKETGITIHEVNRHYDQGRIIDQKKIKVFDNDTPESLESRVKKEEKPFYAQTIKKILKI